MEEIEISIQLEDHGGSRHLIMDHVICDPASAPDMLEHAIRFAHAAGLEIYIRYNDGEWEHVPDADFLAFCDAIVRKLQGGGQ